MKQTSENGLRYINKATNQTVNVKNALEQLSEELCLWMVEMPSEIDEFCDMRASVMANMEMIEDQMERLKTYVRCVLLSGATSADLNPLIELQIYDEEIRHQI